jgi:hypothetical protein
MLSPSEINIAALPSVSLNERSLLPSRAGIYFAIASDHSVQYIGKSINLQSRWQQHHRFKQLQNKGPIKLAWLDCPSELLDGVEAALIDYFQPCLNGKSIEACGSRKTAAVYLGQGLKERLERLAAARNRSVSNLLETLAKEEIEKAVKAGEIDA